MIKLAIVGSRNWPTDFLIDVLASRLAKDTLIVSGEAPGVDTWAKQAAARYGLEYKGFPAEWDKYGYNAGKIRNWEMAQFVDEVIAFHYKGSSGTAHMIEKTCTLKKPLTVFLKTEALGLCICLYGPPSRLDMVSSAQ